MLDTKFAFTLYDLIGHVIPGTFVLLVTVWIYDISVPENAVVATTFFLVFGYVIGHVLHAVGSWLSQRVWWMPKKLAKWLDIIFGNIRSFLLIRVRESSKDVKIKIWKELIRTGLVSKKDEMDELELYDYCCNVLLESGEAVGRDVLEAKEAFYRSLVPTVIYVAILLSLRPPIPFFGNKILMVFTTLLLTEFFYFRREYYRRIKNNQIYKQALIKLRRMNANGK